MHSSVNSPEKFPLFVLQEICRVALRWELVVRWSARGLALNGQETSIETDTKQLISWGVVSFICLNRIEFLLPHNISQIVKYSVLQAPVMLYSCSNISFLLLPTRTRVRISFSPSSLAKMTAPTMLSRQNIVQSGLSFYHLYPTTRAVRPTWEKRWAQKSFTQDFTLAKVQPLSCSL